MLVLTVHPRRHLSARVNSDMWVARVEVNAKSEKKTGEPLCNEWCNTAKDNFQWTTATCPGARGDCRCSILYASGACVGCKECGGKRKDIEKNCETWCTTANDGFQWTLPNDGQGACPGTRNDCKCSTDYSQGRCAACKECKDFVPDVKDPGQDCDDCGDKPKQGSVAMCPGTNKLCEGNECCPKTALHGGNTFPCPSASKGWNQCETQAGPRPTAQTLTNDITKAVNTITEKMKDTLDVNKDLRFPEELRPPADGSPILFKMQQTRINTPWVGGYYWTRGYGSIPGPTIVVKPGQTLEIKLENALGTNAAKECTTALLGMPKSPMSICNLNTTNLHTHGLHTSAKGNGDNIFIKVEPGEKFTYRIEIPKNHMPGIHWYHPHQHHATSSQAGGGAHGAIVVEAPLGYLPTQVEKMPTKVMVFSLVNVPGNTRIETWGEGNLWRKTYLVESMLGSVFGQRLGTVMGMVGHHLINFMSLFNRSYAPQVVINGQWRPTLSVKSGEWVRIQMVMASIELFVELYETGHSERDDLIGGKGGKGGKGSDDQGGKVGKGGNVLNITAKLKKKHRDPICQFRLLAKDGVYLHDAPRTVERIYMASGSRVEVAMACTCPRPPCEVHMDFYARFGEFATGATGPTYYESKGEAMRINVLPGESSGPPQEIAKFTVQRPCYLVDLRKASVKKKNVHTLELRGQVPFSIRFDGHGDLWDHHNPKPLGWIPVAEIQEWEVSGINRHPFHIHVYPFQIQNVGKGRKDNYFMRGDWHDTLLLKDGSAATVRLNPDYFTGKTVLHCHILEHEDNGMMGFIEVTGVQGTRTPAAKRLDPNCYESAFVDTQFVSTHSTPAQKLSKRSATKTHLRKASAKRPRRVAQRRMRRARRAKKGKGRRASATPPVAPP